MSKPIRIKLRCDQVTELIYGKVVGLSAVNGALSKENKKYFEQVSAVETKMQINKEFFPNYELFKPGKDYYIDIIEAPETKVEEPKEKPTPKKKRR